MNQKHLAGNMAAFPANLGHGVLNVGAPTGPGPSLAHKTATAYGSAESADDHSDSAVTPAESIVKVKYRGTDRDKKDMWRMGKRQQLRRNFGTVSAFCFSIVMSAAWEAQLSLTVLGLVNGGTGGLIWMMVACLVGYFCAYSSMAEMASM